MVWSGEAAWAHMRSRASVYRADLVGFVQVVRAGQGLAVDDVGQLRRRGTGRC